MKQTLLACAALALLTPVAASADGGSRALQVQYSQPSYGHHDNRGPSVDERVDRIKERIEQGIGDGRITRREAGQLQRQLASVRQKERSYLADGHLDRRETTVLNRDLDRLASNVRSQLHDDDRSY